MHGFEAQGGGPVDWSKAKPVLAQLQRRRRAQLVQTGHERTPSDKCSTKDTKVACHNPSTHDSCGDYFNASAASAVFAEQSGIVKAFGFASCCDGGATSTNTPQFELPMRESAWVHAPSVQGRQEGQPVKEIHPSRSTVIRFPKKGARFVNGPEGRSRDSQVHLRADLAHNPQRSSLNARHDMP